MKLILFILAITFDLYSQSFDPNSVSTGFKPASFDLISKIKEVNPNKISHRGLPSSYDLSSSMPPVGNQGQQGSCVAWSVAYATKSYQEFMERKDNGNWKYTESGKTNPKTVFSPAFIYNQINGGKDNGSVIENALSLIVSKGAVPWDVMPYDSKDYRTQPNKEQFNIAQKFKAKEFLRIKSTEINDIKNQLTLGRPVVTGIPVSEGFYSLKKTDVYKTPKGTNLGGHAITIVGYDDSLRAFKIQNSWGTSWGDNGFGWIDYQFFMKNAYMGYVLIDIIDKKNTENDIIPQTTVEDTSFIIEEIQPPKEIYATSGNFSDKIVLNWTKVKNVIGYEIYRSYPEENNYQKIGISQTASFEDTSIQPDQAYSYKLTSVSDEEISSISEATATGYADSEKKIEYPEKINNVSASLGSFTDKIVLQWSLISTATEYNIYKFNESNNTFKLIGKTKNAFYEDKSAKRNAVPETYIIAGQNNQVVGIASDVVVGKTANEVKPSPIQTISATNGQYKDKIIVKWSSVQDAASYYVYRFFREKWEIVSETVNTEFIDSNVKKGYYYYTVIAKNQNNILGEYSKYTLGFIDTNLKRGESKLEAPQSLVAKIDKPSNSATLSWSKVLNANEYNLWEKKQGDTKWKFKTKIDSTKQTYTFQIPEKEKFFIYSITAKTEMGADSEHSNIATILISEPKPPVKSRAFGNTAKLDKFKGTWSAIKWDGNTGSKNVVMEISSESDSELKIIFDNRKVLKARYIAGSNSIDLDGKLKISLSGSEGALNVELSDKTIINDKAELSFLKE